MTLFTLYSCVNKINDAQDEESSVAKIMFKIKEYEQEPFSDKTRAVLSKACSHLTYIDCVNGKEEQKIDQTSSENGFGIITTDLSFGTHELFFIGHNQDNLDFNINNYNLLFSKIGDTFTHYLSIEVNQDTKSSQSISLVRQVAKFELVATDAIPTNITSLYIVATNGSTTLNAKNGKGGIKSIQSKTINIPISFIGTKNNTFSCYTFLPSNDSAEMSFSVSAKDKDGNIMYSHQFENVPMEINSITRYSGIFFSNEIKYTGTIIIDDEWKNIINNNF